MKGAAAGQAQPAEQASVDSGIYREEQRQRGTGRAGGSACRSRRCGWPRGRSPARPGASAAAARSRPPAPGSGSCPPATSRWRRSRLPAGCPGPSANSQRLHQGLEQPLLRANEKARPCHSMLSARVAIQSRYAGWSRSVRKQKPFSFKPDDQRLQHRRRPGVLARPDAQVRHQDVAGTDIAQRLAQEHRRWVTVSLGNSSPRKPAGDQPT